MFLDEGIIFLLFSTLRRYLVKYCHKSIDKEVFFSFKSKTMFSTEGKTERNECQDVSRNIIKGNYQSYHFFEFFLTRINLNLVEMD